MKTKATWSVIPFLSLALLMSCSGNKTEETKEVDTKVAVKTEKVSIEDVEQIYEFSATVDANVVNNIAPQSPVRIDRLLVEIGDRVRKGQQLAQMDQTNLNQAKAQLDNNRIEFERMDELYKIGGASKSVWDARKMALDVSETAYNNLSQNTTLISPVNGIVSARNYDNGDMYTGLPVFVVQEIRPVKLLINVSEIFYTKVKKGMDVDIRVDVFENEVFKGNVSLVYPTIDPATRTFTVEIKIPNADERVRPGMYARATLNFGTTQNVVIADQSIIKQPGSGDRYVYIYKNGKIEYAKVELGRRMNERYEVISGVQDGDEVVISGQTRLTNGMEVDKVN